MYIYNNIPFFLILKNKNKKNKKKLLHDYFDFNTFTVILSLVLKKK